MEKLSRLRRGIAPNHGNLYLFPLFFVYNYIKTR